MTSPNGTIVTQIPRMSSGIDNTRPGWPDSSSVRVFNRNGGPSATEALHGVTDDPGTASIPDAAVNAQVSSLRETVELIDQGTLSLGDGLQRGTRPPQSTVAGEAAGSRAPPPSQTAPEEMPALSRETEVRIEICAVPRLGGRPRRKETYPFGSIGLACKVDGEMEGESFLIPFDDHPLRRLAAGRKRHKPKRFITRKVENGVRVWRDR